MKSRIKLYTHLFIWKMFKCFNPTRISILTSCWVGPKEPNPNLITWHVSILELELTNSQETRTDQTAKTKSPPFSFKKTISDHQSIITLIPHSADPIKSPVGGGSFVPKTDSGGSVSVFLSKIRKTRSDRCTKNFQQKFPESGRNFQNPARFSRFRPQISRFWHQNFRF